MDMYKGLVRQHDTGRIRGVILSGRPGIGKTASVMAFAEQHPLVEIPMAPKLAEDFGSYAYPMVIDGVPKVVSLLAEESIEPLLEENIGEGVGVLLLDDVTAAEPRLQSAILDLVQFGRIANRRLGKNVVIFCTGNEAGDGSYASPWSRALISRSHFISYEPDFTKWLNYPCNIDIDPSVVAFLKQHPEGFAPAMDDLNWTDRNGCAPNPREWTALGLAMKAYGGYRDFTPTVLFDSAAVWVQSFIGEKAMHKFVGFMSSFGIYPSPEELVQDPTQWNKLKKIHRDHLAGALSMSFGLRALLVRESKSGAKTKIASLCENVLAALAVVANDHLEVFSFFMKTLVAVSTEAGVPSLAEKFNAVFLKSEFAKNREVMEMFRLLWEVKK